MTLGGKELKQRFIKHVLQAYVTPTKAKQGAVTIFVQLLLLSSILFRINQFVIIFYHLGIVQQISPLGVINLMY